MFFWHMFNKRLVFVWIHHVWIYLYDSIVNQNPFHVCRNLFNLLCYYLRFVCTCVAHKQTLESQLYSIKQFTLSCVCYKPYIFVPKETVHSIFQWITQNKYACCWTLILVQHLFACTLQNCVHPRHVQYLFWCRFFARLCLHYSKCAASFGKQLYLFFDSWWQWWFLFVI